MKFVCLKTRKGKMINKISSNNFKENILLLFISSKEFKEFTRDKWYSINNLENGIYRINVYEVK